MATVNLPIANNPASTSVRYSVSGGSWPNAFAGIGYTGLPGAPTTDVYTETGLNSGFVQLSRQFLQIDTSTIPVGATITAATFTMTNLGIGSCRSDDGINIVLIPTILTSLTTTSQAARANWTMGTSLGSAPISSWVGGQITAAITLNSAGLANIAKGGTTYMGMVTSYDISQTIPTGINNIDNWSNTGTTPPVFSVTYTLPTSSSFFFAAAR